MAETLIPTPPPADGGVNPGERLPPPPIDVEVGTAGDSLMPMVLLRAADDDPPTGTLAVGGDPQDPREAAELDRLIDGW